MLDFGVVGFCECHCSDDFLRHVKFCDYVCDCVLNVEVDADSVLCEIGVVLECDGCPDRCFDVNLLEPFCVVWCEGAAVCFGVE